MSNAADRAKRKYEEKRKKMTVSFNIENDSDIERLHFIKEVDFSNFVKRMIDDEINKNKSLVTAKNSE